MTTPPSWAQAWGVAEGYHTAAGDWVQAPYETVATILASMGAGHGGGEARRGPDGGPDGSAAVLVTRPDASAEVGGPAVVVTEDGRELATADGRLPTGLPLGYHQLHPVNDAPPTLLIVSPGRCVLPPQQRAWGWAAQLYAVRSRASWGMGDLGDLGDLGRWSGQSLGAGFTLLNPLHASLPGVPQEPSPYFPSSRRYRNPLYLRIEDVPGADRLGAELDGLAAAGRELNRERLIDRDAVWRLKAGALDRLWELDGHRPRPAFDEWCRAEGPGLEDFTAFCVLSEQFGRPWNAWPASYRHPTSPAVSELRRAYADRSRFHAWVQWLLDSQLSAAEAHLPVVHDVAVGFDATGADAWAYQDTVAFDFSVGAPPDEFNTQGQDWGAPPFDPWRLRAAGYQPFVDMLRAGLRSGGGARIDHVMGLFRLFWLPREGGPAKGTYVRYPADDLLDIVALESHRAGAFVVGEDLGTVEPHVREAMRERDVLSYRLLWFDANPRHWPELAMGAVTTHDLPTVAGLWTGSDLAAQRAAGTSPNEASATATRDRLAALGGHPPEASPVDVVVSAYRELSAAPSRLLAATIEDALAAEERPNMPGTVDQWPNWSLALPVPLDELPSHPGPSRLAEVLGRADT